MNRAQRRAAKKQQIAAGKTARGTGKAPAKDSAAARDSAALLPLNYDPALTPQQLSEAHCAWAARHGAPLYPDGPAFGNDRTPDRPLRVGYVSPDFRRHPVAFFVEPILRSHDRQAVTAVCYDCTGADDDMNRHLRRLVPLWRDVAALDDAALAETIRADRIDILVDLAGHTAGNRLLTFARRPTPVQVTAIGYPATTGLDVMDYRLTDAWCDPPGSEAHCSERLWHLPGGFNCYVAPQGLPDPSSPPSLARSIVTFGSFNNLDKTSPQVFDLWAKILEQVPGSRLMLKTKSLSQRSVRQPLLARFAARGIAPDRIELVEWSATLRAHFEAYRRLDIALDPFPYNGTTTTCEALMMGVPVIALAGDRHAARVSASILTRLGLEDLLVAPDPGGYVARAVGLASQPEALGRLHAGLRRRLIASPLCDAAGYTRRLEDAYRAMWRRWCDGLPASQAA